MLLITADWHLDDNPANEYRWAVFDHVHAARADHGVAQVLILGDLVDRKDRFTGAFVNRLLSNLHTIAPVVILRGNHDSALRPPHYFDWLSDNEEMGRLVTDDLMYISQPTEIYGGTALMLPFTPTPSKDWEHLRLDERRAVFMHQTVSGARVDNGLVLEAPDFPPLPQHVRFFSGDVHHPQQVRNVVYCGAPHPIKFGDTYVTRMLVVNAIDFSIITEIRLNPSRKLMANIRQLSDLARLKVRPGDQVRLRLDMGDDLGQAEAEIAAWAKAKGVGVAGIEIVVTTAQAGGVDTSETPEALLRQFAAHEGLADDVLAVGLELLEE